MENASNQSLEAPLLRYGRLLVRRKWTIAAFTALLTLTVLVSSLTSTKYYSATATIEISPKAPMIMDMRQVSELVPQLLGQIPQYYETQYDIMKSDRVLTEAIRRLKTQSARLQKGLPYIPVKEFEGEEQPAALLRSYLTIKPEPDTHLVHVVIEHPDPELAALYANTVVEAYMAMNLERSLESSKEALKWLNEERERYRLEQLKSAEKVQEFRASKGIVFAEGTQSATTETLESLQAAWSDAHTRRVIAESAQSELQRLKNAGGLALANHLAHESPTLEDLLQTHQTALQEQDKIQAKYKPGFPERDRVDQEVAQLERQIRDQVDTIVKGQKASLELIQVEEQQLFAELERVKKEMDLLGEDLIALKMLTGEATRNEQFFKDIDIRVAEVGLSQVLQASNIHPIDDAVPGTRPVRPKVLLNVLGALLFGIFGGALLALIIEYLDSTIQSREDVETATGVPLLGVVPMLSRDQLSAVRSAVDADVIVHALPRSNVAECMRTIRTNLLLRSPNQRPIHTLLVTSAAPREGKSFISANLSTIMAMAGNRVLAIDGDLRRPTLHQRFHVPNEAGLADVLSGTMSLADAVQRTHVPGLHVLVTGPSPSNPSELLSMERFRAFIDGIKDYDFILIDSPPVNVVSDALVLASICDAAVFVIEAGGTTGALARICCDRLREVNPALLGTIVNKVNTEQNGYSYYYSYADYSYYQNTPAEPKAP